MLLSYWLEVQPAPPEPAHQTDPKPEQERALDWPQPHWELPNPKTVVQPWLPDSKSQRPKVQAVGVWGTEGVKVIEKVGVGVRVGVRVGEPESVKVCVGENVL